MRWTSGLWEEINATDSKRGRPTHSDFDVVHDKYLKPRSFSFTHNPDGVHREAFGWELFGD